MTPSREDRIQQLVHRSRCRLIGSEAAIEAELAGILQRSTANNVRHGVTGALMLTASMFIQVLEGTPMNVERTFERICCDTRHSDVELISFMTVPSRSFRKWHMRRVQADEALEALLLDGAGPNETAGGTAEAVKRAVSLMIARVDTGV